MRYIGIDVYRDYFEVAIPKFNNSEVYDIKKYNYYGDELESFLRSLSSNFVSIIISRGIYSANLGNQIFSLGQNAAIIHSQQVLRYSQIKLKKEKIDAIVLSKYGEDNKPVLYSPTPDFIKIINNKWEDLKHLLSSLAVNKKRLSSMETAFVFDESEKVKLLEHIERNNELIKKFEDETVELVDKFINPFIL